MKMDDEGVKGVKKSIFGTIIAWEPNTGRYYLDG